MARFTQPPAFKFIPEEWEEWISNFESFRVCTQQYKEPEVEQIYALKYTMGNTEAEKIFKTFKFEGKWNAPKKDNRSELEERNEDPNDYDCVIEKFNKYFIPIKNRRHERAVSTANAER